MPLRRLSNKCLLKPGDLPPSQDDLEVIGVFNPGATTTAQGAVLLVRVAEWPKERRAGYTGLPRWDAMMNRVVIDWERDENLEPVDARVVRRKADGLVRLNFISHLRVVLIKDGIHVSKLSAAALFPAGEYEEFGVEDPRITVLDGAYYITYVAVSRHGGATALASTKDFKSFNRHGIIFCPENKDVVLFPEKIGDRYRALHRPNGATPFTRPEMWLASSPDLLAWGNHEHFLGGASKWDVGRIGAGAPPLKTPQGWLEIYHGNSRRVNDPGIGVYSGGALLLETDNPRRILGAASEILVPETDYERNGFVPNVVFPTGIIQHHDTVLVYYGAADTTAAVVEFSLKEMLAALAPR